MSLKFYHLSLVLLTSSMIKLSLQIFAQISVKNLKQLQQFIQGHGRKLFLKITGAEHLLSGLFIGAQV
jgi:hypothetical protein